MRFVVCGVCFRFIGSEPERGSLEESLLWSDPTDTLSSGSRSSYHSDLSGLSRSPRGAGYVFDDSYTTTVLERNGLKKLVRSHQVVDAGCESFHDGLGYTIFSASNYCGLGNQGAVMRWSNVKKENAVGSGSDSSDHDRRGTLSIVRYRISGSKVDEMMM